MGIQYSVNTGDYFKFKDIVKWCNEHQNFALSEKLLLYITDKNINDLEKEYKIERTPYTDYLKNKTEEDYIKYLGYELKEKK